MALSFLIPTAVILLKACDRPEKDWKGNVLPLLLYGIDEDRSEIRGARHNKMKLDEIETLVKKQRVSLILTVNG